MGWPCLNWRGVATNMMILSVWLPGIILKKWSDLSDEGEAQWGVWVWSDQLALEYLLEVQLLSHKRDRDRCQWECGVKGRSRCWAHPVDQPSGQEGGGKDCFEGTVQRNFEGERGETERIQWEILVLQFLQRKRGIGRFLAAKRFDLNEWQSLPVIARLLLRVIASFCPYFTMLTFWSFFTKHKIQSPRWS